MEESKQNQENTEKAPAPKSGSGKNLIFVIAVIIIFIAVFFSVKNWMANITSDNPAPVNGSNPNVLTQTNGDPNTGVEVTAVYKKDESQNQTAFQISFSTHVIDYSGYNFQENIILADNQNKEYKATNITKQGSGHHQSIEISFPAISSPFKLVVKNLAGVPERIFNW